MASADRPTPAAQKLAFVAKEEIPVNGNDPRHEQHTPKPVTFEEQVELWFGETHGRIHAVLVEQEHQGKRLLKVEGNVDMLVRMGRRDGLERASLMPPMRAPAPSGHFDDFEEKTDGGTRLMITREQLNEHVRKAIDGWSVEKETRSELTTYRTIKGNLSTWAKGGIAAVISAGVIGAIVAVKNFFSHIGGHP
jgi:hypothetical protein